jgi:hypothetical protein
MRPKATHARTRPRRDPVADEPLVAWRRRQLLRAGFEASLAAEVAANRAMDVHALLELVDSGCPPELGVRILAPLDYEQRSC